jgi:hypothetical protein
MTTKPKTPIAPAAKAAAPAGEFFSAPFDIATNNISKLIARLLFLEAECRYYAAICDPALKGVALNIRHREERDEIMQRLAKCVPEDFWSAKALLDFATSRLAGWKGSDGERGQITAMLKNVGRGFLTVHARASADIAIAAIDGRLNHFAEAS